MDPMMLLFMKFLLLFWVMKPCSSFYQEPDRLSMRLTRTEPLLPWRAYEFIIMIAPDYDK
jgi:hypothetical protein